MAWIEAGQLSVGNQVQAGQFLRLEDDHHSVTQDQARRIAYEPGWNRITSDDGCLDAFAHFYACVKYSENADLLLDHPREMIWAEYVERQMRCQGELANLQYQI